MNKPTPFFLLAIATILTTLGLVWFIAFVHNAAMDRQAVRFLQSQNTWEPPRISCKPGQELWDCIRYVD